MALDEIHPWILKELAKEVTKTLSSIFEKLWQFGDVPIAWKRENITCVLKRVHKDEMGNYRSVSLTYVSGPIIGQILLENTKCTRKIVR